MHFSSIIIACTLAAPFTLTVAHERFGDGLYARNAHAADADLGFMNELAARHAELDSLYARYAEAGPWDDIFERDADADYDQLMARDVDLDFDLFARHPAPFPGKVVSKIKEKTKDKPKEKPKGKPRRRCPVCGKEGTELFCTNPKHNPRAPINCPVINPADLPNIIYGQ